MSNQPLINCEMICANTNTTLHCLDYNQHYNILAYGSHNLIHINNPSEVKTYLTLKGHTKRVNVIKFIDNHKKEGNKIIELLSAGADGKIIHWENLNNDKNYLYDYKYWKKAKEYKCSELIKNKEIQEENIPSINILEAVYLSSIEKYFTIFSSNGILDLFYFDIDLNEYKLFASLNFTRKLQDAISICEINENYLMMLTGGYDKKINVYTIMRVKTMSQQLILNNNNLEKIKPVEFCTSLVGHENDIRDIAIVSPEKYDDAKSIFFCSCSQDSYIRVWNTTKLDKNDLSTLADNLNTSKTNSIYDEYKSKTSYVIKVPIHDKEDINLKNKYEYYNITLDSVLSGHEDVVSSVTWGKIDDNFVILSSSLDFSVGIWVFDKKYNIWDKKYSLGEMIGNKHAFFYATFLNSYKEVLAYSYHGSLYYWKMNNEGKFEAVPVVHGHFDEVTDIRWDPSNNILFSCSHDETTRCFGKWEKNKSWNEINRPQIHGYPIHSLSCINTNIKKEENKNEDLICKIISASEEKVLRMFNPPFNIIKFLKELSKKELKFKNDNSNEFYEKKYGNVEGSKQALGLLNREVVLEEKDEEASNFDYSKFDPDAILTNKSEQVYVSKYNYEIPPDEDFLSNNTLWPEEAKMYGHGNEIYTIDISHDGKFLASGQKAQEVKNAKLYLWNVETKKLIGKLDGCTLTIVQISFSPKDNYLLTVSRDRSWNLYIKKDNTYELYQNLKNAHKRIIWCCSWSCDEKYFITGSRDKFISIWSKDDKNKFKKYATLENKTPVTAIEFIGKSFQDGDCYVFIVGFEDGKINIGKFSVKNKKIEIIYELNEFLAHCAKVNKIRSFCNKENKCYFATCSEDFSVRIFSFDIKKIENLLNN